MHLEDVTRGEPLKRVGKSRAVCAWRERARRRDLKVVPRTKAVPGAKRAGFRSALVVRPSREECLSNPRPLSGLQSGPRRLRTLLTDSFSLIALASLAPGDAHAEPIRELPYNLKLDLPLTLGALSLCI